MKDAYWTSIPTAIFKWKDFSCGLAGTFRHHIAGNDFFSQAISLGKSDLKGQGSNWQNKNLGKDKKNVKVINVDDTTIRA